MLRIQRSANGEVVFTLSGQMDEDPIAELETLISSEANGRRIALDLKDLTLVNENGISFLERCEANSITLKNCPPYIRRWITRHWHPTHAPYRFNSMRHPTRAPV